MTSSQQSPNLQKESIHPESPHNIFNSLLYKAISSDVDSNVAFYAYRLPNANQINLSLGTVAQLVAGQSFRSPAFLVAAFLPSEPTYIITPHNLIATPIVASLTELSARHTNITTSEPDPDYSKAISAIISELTASRGEGKTVMARRITNHSEIASPATLFHTLAKAYPHAFTFCWCISPGCYWIGATPETLLSATPASITSMALAGTRQVDTDSPWDDKNRQEQQIVTDYINSTFQRAGLNASIHPTVTLKAGPVEHICTPISAPTPSSQFSALDLARRLSPTPAVSGLPVDRAMRQIAKYEQFPRQYYGGYCGPMLSPQSFNLFVTLRCMQVDTESRQYHLYVGGGITAKSTPESEWRETCFKAQTLLNLIPND